MASTQAPSALLLGAWLGVLGLPTLAAEPAAPDGPASVAASSAATPGTPAPAGVVLPYGSGYELRLRASAGLLLETTPLPTTDKPRGNGSSRGTSGGGRGGRGGSGGGRGR